MRHPAARGSTASDQTHRVAPFEHYMLCDDTPAFPMHFFMRFLFDGSLVRSHFEAAVLESIRRHPLLYSVIKGRSRDRTSKLSWLALDSVPLPLVWSESTTPEACPIHPIDLGREVGIRMYGAEHQGRTNLLVQAHHSCCDATGVVRFLEDVLCTYSGCSTLPPWDYSLLDRRLKPGLSLWGWLGRAHIDLRRIAGFLRRRPAPLTTPGLQAKSAGSKAPSLTQVELDQKRTQAYVSCAKTNGVTVNDLLVSDLFLTLQDWNASSAADLPGDLSIGIPINLRLPDESCLPAANRVSMIFLSRSRQPTDPDELLRSVNSETQYLKKYNVALTLGRVLQILGVFPGGIARLFANKKCFATAILSNLREPLAIDSVLECPGAQQSAVPVAADAESPGIAAATRLSLERIELYPPIRDQTDLALGVVTHAGRMCIAMHYNSERLTAIDAEKIIGDYRSRILIRCDSQSGIQESEPTFACTL